jgi:hypothetical protein
MKAQGTNLDFLRAVAVLLGSLWCPASYTLDVASPSLTRIMEGVAGHPPRSGSLRPHVDYHAARQGAVRPRIIERYAHDFSRSALEWPTDLLS